MDLTRTENDLCNNGVACMLIDLEKKLTAFCIFSLVCYIGQTVSHLHLHCSPIYVTYICQE